MYNSRKFKATGQSFIQIHPNAPSVCDVPPKGTPEAAIKLTLIIMEITKRLTELSEFFQVTDS